MFDHKHHSSLITEKAKSKNIAYLKKKKQKQTNNNKPESCIDFQLKRKSGKIQTENKIYVNAYQLQMLYQIIWAKPIKQQLMRMVVGLSAGQSIHYNLRASCSGRGISFPLHHICQLGAGGTVETRDLQDLGLPMTCRYQRESCSSYTMICQNVSLLKHMRNVHFSEQVISQEQGYLDYILS